MEKIISIKAPRLGNFWRAPKTGYAPFVEIGQRVVEDHVVCHIEVMGSFYPVKSGAKCRIAEILAENGQMVEFNQTLFLGTPE